MNVPPSKTKSLIKRAPGWRTILRCELEAAGRLVILGVGNEDRGDDAAGILCVRLLRKLVGNPERRSLMFLEGGVAPESMTGKIRTFRPSHVLILDAVLAGRKPGAIFSVAPQDIAEEELTTHRLPLSLLVRYVEESIGCRVLCLGIQPRALEAGSPVSHSVDAAARTLVRVFASLVKRHRASSGPRPSEAQKSHPRKKRKG